MEVWRHQLRFYYGSAKVYCRGLNVKAMNKYANRGVRNEQFGGCKQTNELKERVVGRWPAELPRFLFTSLFKVPLVRAPQGKKLRKTGTVDTEV